MEGGPPLCRWEPAAQPNLRGVRAPSCPPSTSVPPSDLPLLRQAWHQDANLGATWPLPGSPLQALGSRLHNIDDNISNTMIIKVTKYLPEGPVLGTSGHYLPLPHHPGEEGGENGESKRGSLLCLSLQRQLASPRPIRRRSRGPPLFSKAGGLINKRITSRWEGTFWAPESHMLTLG